MKREVVCEPCRPRAFAVTASSDPFELAEMYANGEETRVVGGKARGNCCCDRCGKDLDAGSPVLAVSYITKRSPYFPWESDYIELPHPKEGEPKP